MSQIPPPRVAIVHDWFDKPGGAERVLHELIECFPDADLFAIVDMLPEADRDTDVLHPPVRGEDFSVAAQNVDYYFTCSRLVKYKRIDLLVEGFLAKPKSELIVLGEGPDLPAMKRRAGDVPTISSVAGPVRKSGNFSGTRAPFSWSLTRTSGSPRSRPRQAAHQ
jgi:glycosyltransferase involved in cell wall biosynthesis